MAKESKATRVSSNIQLRIQAESYEPGTRLGTKPELMAELGVSAGTLNEALRLLQSRGYVEVKTGPRGGVFVAQNVDRVRLSTLLLAGQDDPVGLDDCFHVQDALQEAVCIDAALACGPDDRVRLTDAVRRMRAAVGSADVLKRMWDLDVEIAKTGRNSLLAGVYSMVIDTIRTSVQHWPETGGVAGSTITIHQRMAESVMANDIDGARKAAREHSPIDYAATAKEQLAWRGTSSL